MKSPLRIIDANGNRAREALRVLEEAARFILDDAQAAASLKTMRHRLTQALAEMPELIHHRDTAGDVGTDITTATEQQREGVPGVVSAAGSRLAEALRAIEEYAKTLADHPRAGELAKAAEQLRYQGYELSKQLATALGAGRGKQWRLCLLLSESLCSHHPWQDVLEAALQNGVDCVQVREKAMDSGDLIERVREVVARVDKRAAVIVNDRPDIALLAGADGVHLGQADLSPADTRKLVGDRLVIGVSTANLAQARQARNDGADYCGVGPMFATTTKHKPHLAGPDYLREYLAWDALPHLAIGGIRPDNIGPLVDLGCRGVAVSAAVCSAQDPGTTAATLSEAVRARSCLGAVVKLRAGHDD